MTRIFSQMDRALISAALCLVVLVATAPAAAEIEPSSLRVGQFRGMLGEWVLTVDAPDGELSYILNLLDIGGKLGATLQTPEQAQPLVITAIRESSLALRLDYRAQFGEAESAMTLIIRSLEPGTLTGSLADELGLLTRVTADAEARGLGRFAARVRGVKGGKIPGRTSLKLQGNEIKVTFGGLRTDSADYERLEALEEGEVFSFAGARATKLFTRADLAFGNTIIMNANAAADFPHYPGVYSLWLKRTGNGWSLVFNGQPDIWGTMRDPDEDVAEIPLTLAQSDQKQARFEVELQERGDGGVLQMSWGSNIWTAPFSVLR